MWESAYFCTAVQYCVEKCSAVYCSGVQCSEMDCTPVLCSLVSNGWKGGVALCGLMGGRQV